MNFTKITIITALLAVNFACSSKKDSPKQTTPAKVEQQSLGSLKMAYYDQDTLSEQFDFFKEQQSAMEKKQKAFQGKIDQMTREYQDFLKRNDERNRQGLLSQVQLQQIQEEAMMKEQSIVEFQQTNGAKLEKEAFDKMNDLNKKVESYSRMFSEENGIDVLFIKAKGGQLAYIKSSMDVTQEFLEYLNAREEEIKKDMGSK